MHIMPPPLPISVVVYVPAVACETTLLCALPTLVMPPCLSWMCVHLHIHVAQWSTMQDNGAAYILYTALTVQYIYMCNVYTYVLNVQYK